MPKIDVEQFKERIEHLIDDYTNGEPTVDNLTRLFNELAKVRNEFYDCDPDKMARMEYSTFAEKELYRLNIFETVYTVIMVHLPREIKKRGLKVISPVRVKPETTEKNKNSASAVVPEAKDVTPNQGQKVAMKRNFFTNDSGQSTFINMLGVS